HVMRGHIRKRGRNTWEIKLDGDRLDGQRHTIYRNVKGSKRDAHAEAAKLITQIEAGAHVEPRRLTAVGRVGDREALRLAAGSISARTAQGYAGLIANQYAPFPIASRRLQKLSSSDVEIWHSQLRTEGRRNGKGGVSTRTIHHAHKLLAKTL